jgi:topoisomerase IA-like protein
MSRKGPLLLREAAAAAAAAAASSTVFYGWPTGTPFESITLEQANAFVATAVKSKEGEVLGDWKGKPVVKRVGKYGPYVTWGDVRLSLGKGEVEALEAIGGRLDAVAAAATAAAAAGTPTTGVLRTFKDYEIKHGPYGPYIYKPALKKRQFVSLPKHLKPEDLKESEVAELYKKGLEAKKRRPAVTAEKN